MPQMALATVEMSKPRQANGGIIPLTVIGSFQFKHAQLSSHPFHGPARPCYRYRYRWRSSSIELEAQTPFHSLPLSMEPSRSPFHESWVSVMTSTVLSAVSQASSKPK